MCFLREQNLLFIHKYFFFDIADMISASQLSTFSLANDDTTLWLSVAHHSVYITTRTESHHHAAVEIWFQVYR